MVRGRVWGAQVNAPLLQLAQLNQLPGMQERIASFLKDAQHMALLAQDTTGAKVDTENNVKTLEGIKPIPYSTMKFAPGCILFNGCLIDYSGHQRIVR